MLLRNFTDADIPQLQAHVYCDMPYDDLRTLIEAWSKNKFENNYFEMFAIVEGDDVIGQASLYGRSEHIVSCGLELYSAYCGKGFGTAAYHELLGFAKRKGYDIAVAQVRVDNAASVALNKKMGFEAEDYIYINQKGEPIYYFVKAL